MHGVDGKPLNCDRDAADSSARQKSTHHYTPMDVPAAPAANVLPSGFCGASLLSDKSMSGSVRVMLVLAAERGFDLLEGENNSTFAAQFEELGNSLVSVLETLASDVGQAGNEFLIQKALKAVSAMREAVHTEIVDRIEEGSDTTALLAALEVVKKSAVEAAMALETIETSTDVL